MWFPLCKNGGLIRSGAAASLLDRTDPFKMSPGQWQFLFSDHQASCVEALSSVESLSVDTGVLISSGSDLEEGTKDSWDFGISGEEVMKPPARQTVSPEEPSPGLDSPLMDLPPHPEMADVEDETIEAIFGSEGVEAGREALDPLLHSVDLHMEKQQWGLLELHWKFGNVNQHLMELEKIPAQIPGFATRIGAVETAASEATHGLSTLGELGEGLCKMQWEFKQPSGKIAVLTSAIKRVKGRVDDSGIECHQTRFSSKQDFIVWCADRSVSVACFCDAMAGSHECDWLPSCVPRRCHQDTC